MCGIVGFTSRTASAVGPLVNGLRRLEYRGYDSAGVALEGADGLRVYKQTGKVAELDKLLKGALKTEEEQAKYTIGIAHTRWATHGLPTRANAHPHVADDGNLALVHNGIIENYAALRTGLEKRCCTFLSQTDTEVLAHLVATFDRGDFLSAVSQALKQVEGTYGIATISAKHPGEMIVARKGSPLVIGLGEDETVVASDVSAIVAYTRQVVYLKDGDIARVTPEGVQIYSLDNAPVSREVQEVDWDLGAIEKGGFDHFMLKEIFEQPDALRNTIRGRLDKQGATAVLAGLNLSPRDLAAIRRLVIIGCGTSLHAGMVGKYLFERVVRTFQRRANRPRNSATRIQSSDLMTGRLRFPSPARPPIRWRPSANRSARARSSRDSATWSARPSPVRRAAASISTRDPRSPSLRRRPSPPR